MDDIKIVRLQTGEDVVASYTTDQDGLVFLSNPMVFVVKRTSQSQCSIFLTSWLPIDVVEKNVAQITKDDILCIFTPTEQFKKYYFKMIFEAQNGVGSFDGPISDDEDYSESEFDEDVDYDDGDELDVFFEPEFLDDNEEAIEHDSDSFYIEGNETLH
jgi:hypothetical protein